LLSGTPPFYEEDNFELFEQIKACKYDFDVETWSGVSEDAKDFIRKVLVASPEQRYNCDQMLAHQWMKTDLT
jgi:calcium/calmodulin-dependent protein kinase I